MTPGYWCRRGVIPAVVGLNSWLPCGPVGGWGFSDGFKVRGGLVMGFRWVGVW